MNTQILIHLDNNILRKFLTTKEDSPDYQKLIEIVQYVESNISNNYRFTTTPVGVLEAIGVKLKKVEFNFPPIASETEIHHEIEQRFQAAWDYFKSFEQLELTRLITKYEEQETFNTESEFVSTFYEDSIGRIIKQTSFHDSLCSYLAFDYLCNFTEWSNEPCVVQCQLYRYALKQCEIGNDLPTFRLTNRMFQDLRSDKKLNENEKQKQLFSKARLESIQDYSDSELIHYITYGFSESPSSQVLAISEDPAEVIAARIAIQKIGMKNLLTNYLKHNPTSRLKNIYPGAVLCVNFNEEPLKELIQVSDV